jgi:energy-coupling factor transporter ATP-binding protein EcfA2
MLMKRRFMLYKITFFKTQIQDRDWNNLLHALFSVTSKLHFAVIIQGQKLDYYIISDKKLTVLNSRLFPFYLTDEYTENELRQVYIRKNASSLAPEITKKSLIKLIENKHLDNKPLIKITFSISKYNLLRNLLRAKLFYQHGTKILETKVTILNSLDKFLAFDLSNSINSEISKVKPVLSNNKLNFNTHNQGILELKQLEPTQLFATSSYDFNRHSLIVGQSGSGKTYLLKLMIEDILKKQSDDYGVVLIDPHANLSKMIASKDSENIDFINTKTNLFINIGQPVLSTELTMDLLSTVLNIHQNPNLKRVLKYSLNTLFSINKMSLDNLKKILTDSIFRKELLKEVEDSNNLQFFETEYQKLYTSEYSTAVLPIVNLLSELDFIQKAPSTIELKQQINNNKLVTLPINQANLGSTVCKVVGGAIIQQIFTLMQAGQINKKIILIVDEFSLVQTPSLIHILSEARKFGLTVVFAQQYLMQVSGELLQSVFANVVNYFCFKMSRDDAEVIARNLNFEIDEYFLKNKNDPREMLELGVKLLTDLNPRDLIVRAMVESKYYSPFKAKTVTVK